MRTMNCFDVARLVRELEPALGARIDKIYHEADAFFLVTRRPAEEKRMMAIVLPQSVFWCSKKPESGVPGAFCEHLRTLLEGAHIESIIQHGLERIIELVLSHKDGARRLIIELFSTGNLIVCDEKGTILLPYRSQEWKDRAIKRGIAYQLPPQKHNPLNSSKPEWVKQVSASQKPVSASLAVEMGLGGEVALLACKECAIDPQAKSISQKDASCIYDTVRAWAANPPIKPLSHELDQEFQSSLIVQPKQSPQHKKLEVMVQSQREAIKKFGEEAQRFMQAGERIYECYQEIQELLAKAKKAKDLKALEGHPLVKKVDPTKRTIVVEL